MHQHRQLDSYAEQLLAGYRAQDKAIHCRAGCAGCCHLAVHATFPEAAAIARQLSPHQTGQLSSYIDRLKQALATTSDLRNYLKNHRISVGPCPFLDGDGCCSIYPDRPLSCRALLSTRPADWCTVDFAELDEWDRQAYESGLDREVVAWPTHFVAATQELGRELEDQLLDTMRQQKGWALAGNLAAMVWLEHQHQLDRRGITTARQVREVLAAEGLGRDFLLQLAG